MGTAKRTQGIPTYRRLYQQLVSEIEQAQRTAGEVLPSLRTYAAQQGISLNTAIRVYHELEQHGWIEGRERRGFRIRRQPSAPSPAPPAYVAVASTAWRTIHAAGHCGELAFGSAHPHLDFPAIRQLYRQVARCAHQQPATANVYNLPPGDARLRQQLAHQLRLEGHPLDADELLITNGAQEALTLSLQAITRPGDTVVVESPCYFGTLQALEALRLKVVEVPASAINGIEPDRLAQVFDTWPVRAMVINGVVNNPQGYIIPAATQRRLLTLAARHGVTVIEDLVFAELAFTASPPWMADSVYREQVISCGSLSKTLDSRLRIGWVRGGQHHDAIRHRKFVGTMSDNPLLQQATAAYLASGHYPRHLRRVRRSYHTAAQRMMEDLGRWLPSGCSFQAPAGGFLLWVRLPEMADGRALFDQLLSEGISLTPGSLFGQSLQYNQAIRLNYAGYHGSDAQRRALRRIGEQIRRQLGP